MREAEEVETRPTTNVSPPPGGTDKEMITEFSNQIHQFHESLWRAEGRPSRCEPRTIGNLISGELVIKVCGRYGRGGGCQVSVVRRNCRNFNCPASPHHSLSNPSRPIRSKIKRRPSSQASHSDGSRYKAQLQRTPVPSNFGWFQYEDVLE